MDNTYAKYQIEEREKTIQTRLEESRQNHITAQNRKRKRTIKRNKKVQIGGISGIKMD
jgi:hypothetical protein